MALVGRTRGAHPARAALVCAPLVTTGCSLLGDTGYLDPARRLPLTQQAHAAHGHHGSGDLVGCDQSVRPGPHFPNVGCSSTSAGSVRLVPRRVSSTLLAIFRNRMRFCS